MQLLPIRNDHNVISIASAVRNVCNATLSLIFTAFLFVWGLLVNKHQAWRTDGGTAAFGVSALSLALVSTALTFLYVPHEEEFLWLPGLIWAVVLWQSFLGWWWWVGAGSGIGEGLDSDAIRRKEKRDVKGHEKKGKDGKTRLSSRGPVATYGTRRRTVRCGSDIEEAGGPRSFPSDDHESPGQIEGSTRSVTVAPRTNLPPMLPPTFHKWYAKIRQAHWSAAKEQAVERIQRIRELENENRQSPWFSSRWGLDYFDFGRIGRTDRGIPQSSTTDRRENAQERESSQNADVLPVDQNSQREQVDHHREGAGNDVAGVRSMWWWGPLRQWRLRDSTVY
jgi:hypothetical protein